MDLLRSFSVADLVREHARTFPDRTALVCGDTRWTYPDLNERADRVAAALAAGGVGEGARVLWLAQNCHRFFEVLFACAKLGAVVVPVNWRGSPEELAHVIEDAGPAVAIWQEEEIGERVAAARDRAGPSRDRIGPSRDPAPAGPGGTATWLRLDAAPETPGSFEGWVAASEAAPAPTGLVGEDLPLVQMYTAAFEGRPRGALLTHRNLLTTTLQLCLAHGYRWDDVYLASGPLFHVLTLMISAAVLHPGGTVVVVRRVIPEEMCRLVEAEKVTRAVIFGPTVAQMVEAAERGGFSLESLRTPPGGGPAADRWRELTTPTGPPIAGYGQTEATGLATFDAWGPPGEGGHGRPGPLVSVAILDEAGADLPPGETGEIAIRGPQVMAGYHAHPEANARRFEGGWARTGDLGRREPDGTLTFIGPRTELIKTGAENVYPAEVEAALRRHPRVRDACVIGVPDPVWRQSVKAVVEPADASATEGLAEALVEHCTSLLAGYKKPRIIAFVEALPRTPAGAVDRAAVARTHGSATP